MSETTRPAVPAVFLDRDGVINEAVVIDGKPYPPATVDAFRYIDGVPESIAALREAGYRIIVVTNQPDVATGKQDRRVVDAIHAKLCAELAVDELLACYHTDQHGCECRKPKPGMLVEAGKRWRIDFSRSYMVGDRWRDITAGAAVGCRTVFIDYGYAEKSPTAPDMTVASLAEATPRILAHT